MNPVRFALGGNAVASQLSGPVTARCSGPPVVVAMVILIAASRS